MAFNAINRSVRLGATTSALALSIGGTALAQETAAQSDAADVFGDVIIVTAQRQSQSLQEVP